jgi:hypothetical protein
VFSVAQIFNSLSQILSTVEHLTLKHDVHSRSSEEHNEVDRTEWRNLLNSFSNLKTLRIEDGLVKELSRSLRPDDGEPLWSCYPNYRSSHILGAAIPVMHSHHSSMPARMQAAP